jgi:hypothetical protein
LDVIGAASGAQDRQDEYDETTMSIERARDREKELQD